MNESRVFGVKKPEQFNDTTAHMVELFRFRIHADQAILLRRSSRASRWQIVASAGIPNSTKHAELAHDAQAVAKSLDQQSPAGAILNIDGLRGSVDDRDPDVVQWLHHFSIHDLGWIKPALRINPSKLGSDISDGAEARPTADTTDESPTDIKRADDVSMLLHWSSKARPVGCTVAGLSEVLTDELNTIALEWWVQTVNDLKSTSKLGTWRNPLTWTFTAKFATCAVLLLAILLIPVPLEIRTRGTLIPPAHQNVHLQEGKVVRSVSVQDGAWVKMNDVLLLLSSRDDEMEMAALTLEVNNINREKRFLLELKADTTKSESELLHIQDRIGTLNSIESRLNERMKRVESSMNTLTISAQLDGEVRISKLLQSADYGNVQYGQWLLSLSDPQPKWLLEANITERDFNLIANTPHFPKHIGASALLPNKARSVIELDYHAMSPPSSSNRNREPTGILRFSVAEERIPTGLSRSNDKIAIRIHAGYAPLCWAFSRDTVLSLWTSVRRALNQTR